MYTQYTSKREKNLIREALTLKTQIEAVRKGWKFIGEGAFRKAYRKGTIVIKFLKKHVYYSDACTREAYYYFKLLKPYQRKNFARIYAWRNDRIVQKYYPQIKKWTIDDEIKANKLVNKFGLKDVEPGMQGEYEGHNLTMYKGRPICYDMDIEADGCNYYNCNLY